MTLTLVSSGDDCALATRTTSSFWYAAMAARRFSAIRCG
jgi:hypothetical protein